MTRRIKVVILVNELLRGGAQRIVSDLACGIDKDKFEVVVVHLKSHKNFGPNVATVDGEIRAAGIRIASLEGALRFSITDLTKLIRFLRTERPDIVHTFLPYAGIVGRIAGRLSRAPRILSTQCNVRVAYNFTGYWIDRLSLPLAHAWSAAAEGIELEYGGSVETFSEESWNAGRRHFTIVAGVDLPAFDRRVQSINKSSKRTELGIPSDIPLVMMVARLIPWKGPIDLVAAMQHLPRSVHLGLVGWGALEGSLKEQASKEGTSERIHFLGARNDVPELLKMADVYVQAHNYAPNGEVWKGPNTSQMEACAAGIPSVSTAVPLIESLIEDHTTGILAKPNDPKDLARAVSHLIDHPYEAHEYAIAARKRVEERFSVDSMVRSYSNLYEALLS